MTFFRSLWGSGSPAPPPEALPESTAPFGWSPRSVVLLGHASGVNAVDLRCDGERVVSGAADRTVRMWDPHSGQCVRTFEGHKAGVLAVKWSPDGSQIASGGADGDDAIKIWDPLSGSCKFTMNGHKGPVYSLTWRGDGKLLASGGADGAIRIWYLEAADEQEQMVTVLRPRGHASELPGVLSVAWGPVGDVIACGTWADTVKVWDAAAGTCMLSLSGHTDWVRSVAWSHDGRRIVSGSADRSLRLWDVAGKKGKGRCVREARGHSKPVRAVAWMKTAPHLVASGSADGSVILWNIADGTQFGRLKGHQEEVTALSWNAHASLLASACAGGRVRVWEIEPNALRYVKPGTKDRVDKQEEQRGGELPRTTPEEVSIEHDTSPTLSAEAIVDHKASIAEGTEHAPDTDPPSPAPSRVEQQEDAVPNEPQAPESPGDQEVSTSTTAHRETDSSPAGKVLNLGETTPSHREPCFSRIRIEDIRSESDPTPSPTNMGLMLSLGSMVSVSTSVHNIPTIPFEDLKMDHQPLMTGPFKAVFRAKLDNKEVAVLIFRHSSINTEAEMMARLSGRHFGNKFVLGTSTDDKGRSVLICEFDALRALDISTTQLLALDTTAKRLDYQEHVVSDAIMTGARGYQHVL